MEERFIEIIKLAEDAVCSGDDPVFLDSFSAGRLLIEAIARLHIDVADHLGREAHYAERFSVTVLALADLAKAILNSSWDDETRDLARDCLRRVLIKEKE